MADRAPQHRQPCSFARPCGACHRAQDDLRTEPVRRALRQAISMFEGLLVRGDLESGDAATTTRWVRRAKRALRKVYGPN